MTPPKITGPFYDTQSRQYWLRFGTGPFRELDGRSVKTQFMLEGEELKLKNDIGLEAGDRMLAIAQRERSLLYAGPIAGHKIGLFETASGEKVLVTSEARLIQPKPGPIVWWDKFLGELFRPAPTEPTEQAKPAEQADQFLYWLKCSLESLEAGTFRPGQFLVLAGESGCGKSLLQTLLTRLFGGRVAQPYRYMSGRTPFNGDLAKAEHLMISDESGAIDIKSRRDFGEHIKNRVANAEMSIHRKYGEAITLPVWNRVTASLNNQAEALMILPPMNKSLADKIHLFYCQRAEVGEDRAATMEAAAAEMPALVAHVRRLRIPAKFKDSRYGVKAYHNEELVAMLASYSPEITLGELIDEVIEWDLEKVPSHWRGTASELEKLLRKSELGFKAERLFSGFSNSCGTYLGRLAATMPERITSKKNKGKTVWTINPPTEEAE